VNKLVLTKLLITGILTLVCIGAATAQISPTPYFTSFYDSASTYLGQPLVPGSIITAYDPDNVLCGIDTVHTAGYYGFMPVYGDESGTVPDEGAEDGDTIRFEINGRPATVVSGDPTFTDQAQKDVRLSATATIALTAIELPTAKAVTFNDTVRFEVGIRNDGDGLDFYGVSATNSLAGFNTLPQDTMFYAEPGETIYVYFEISSPTFSADTVDNASFSVYSMLDPTVKIDGNVDLFFTITDVDDEDGTILPGGFAVYQNFPNPFNPTTTIQFSLPSRSRVELQVIDVLGRYVDSRDLGNLGAGDHEVTYDASGLASGVYFYRVVTDMGYQTRKMVLLK